jgi:hydroxyacylglutathione hydrolase/adenylyltransferase/sulfurtransferase
MSHPLDDPEIEVTPERAQELQASGAAVIVDVREPYEWEAGRIDGATHIALERLSSQAESLPKEQTIVFQCRLGSRSLMAAQAFRRAGYDAWSMAGGLQAWSDAGLPLTPDDGVVADH